MSGTSEASEKYNDQKQSACGEKKEPVSDGLHRVYGLCGRQFRRDLDARDSSYTGYHRPINGLGSVLCACRRLADANGLYAVA